MTDAFLTAIKTKKPVSIVDIELPSGAGGTQYVASEPFWHYRQEVMNGGFGSVRSGVSYRPGANLGVQTFDLTLVEDATRRWSALLYGRYNPRRSRVFGRVAVDGLDEDDWFTFFDGVLDDWDVSDQRVVLKSKTDDTALDGYLEPVPILAGAHPGAPTTILGTYLPIVLGIHDSTGLLSDAGMVTAVPISIDATLGYKYAVSLGTCADVTDVWKNATALTVTTHYTVAQETFGGATMTVITLTSSSTEDDVITCNVEGLTDDGTISGSVILDPTDQLKWICNNLIWGDWKGGDYETDAPLDLAAFSAVKSYGTAFGYEGSMRFGGTTAQTKGLDAINDWLRSHPTFRLRWGFDGNLGPVVIDHRFGGYSDDNWIDGDSDELRGTFKYPQQAGGLVSKIAMQYLYGEAAGRYWQSLEVQDLKRAETEKGTEPFDLVHSPARFQ